MESNSLCSSVIRCSAGSMRAVRSTICWVRASRRAGALTTRSRISSKASRCDSSSRSARAAATITSVSSSRRCCPGLGYRVVELLTHGESLGQSGFGAVDRAGERLGPLLAELLDRQRQLVGAGAHRVVDVDDFPPGQVVEGAQRQCRQRIGVGGVDPFGRGQLGGPTPTAPATHDHVQQPPPRPGSRPARSAAAPNWPTAGRGRARWPPRPPRRSSRRDAARVRSGCAADRRPGRR